MQVDPAKRKDKITAPQANIEEAFNDCVESLSDAKLQRVLEMLDQGTS